MPVESISEVQANQRVNTTRNNADGTTVPAKRSLTDDEILGLGIRNRTRRDTRQQAAEAGENATDSVSRPDLETGDSGDAVTEMPQEYREVLEANPELKRAWDDAQVYRQIFATPEEAQTATRIVEDVRTLDRLFYSNRAEDHTRLAHLVAELDPAAFASLAKVMASVANEAHGEGKPEESAKVASSTGEKGADGARTQTHDLETADARERFVRAANEEAIRSVLGAIESQVDRVLPGNTGTAARNRLVGEIYRELDNSLQSNPEFAKHVRHAFQSGRLDARHRSAVASLITSRAKQSLPAAVKRVLGEWTSTVLATTGERQTRQRSAENRVDIGGARGGAEPHRARSPRDIDYKRMSDADILNL